MAIDDFSLKDFGRSTRALEKKLSQKAGDAITGLDEPWRSATRNLVDTALPGFGGGTPDLRDNTYANIVQGKLQETFREFDQTLAEASVLSSYTSSKTSKTYDWRARLRPKNGGIEQFYARAVEGGFTANEDYLMRPIVESGGMIWQNTPSLVYGGSASYNSETMQGMNYPINTYKSSNINPISLISTFTANTIDEARYMLAALTFLKIATKSYFGDQAVNDGMYGTPPPVLLFEYMGDHMFNKVPVVVTRYDMPLPDDVDYVPVQQGETVTYVPAMATITVELLPTYTPQKLRKRFSVEALANGALYRDGFV